MSDIFQEIDEDLRRDKAQALWSRYQNLVYVAVAIAVLGTAGTTLWRIYDARVKEQAGATYLSALYSTGQDAKAAIDVFASIANENGPTAALARFDMARSALQSGDKQAALDMLAAIAVDAKVDAPMQGVAAISASYLALDLGKGDQALSLAQPLLADGNPYRLMALEVTGLVAHAAGDNAKARQIFTDLEPLAAAPDAPSQLRDRVAVMLDRLAQ